MYLRAVSCCYLFVTFRGLVFTNCKLTCGTGYGNDSTTVEVGSPAQKLSQSARAWMQLKLLLAVVLEKLCYHARFPRGLKAFSTPLYSILNRAGWTFSCSSPSRFNEQEVYLLLYSVSIAEA
jgi:hypothetical protein